MSTSFITPTVYLGAGDFHWRAVHAHVPGMGSAAPKALIFKDCEGPDLRQ